MKRLALLAAMALAGLMAVPAVALADHIQVANNANDAWVTASSPKCASK